MTSLWRGFYGYVFFLYSCADYLLINVFPCSPSIPSLAFSTVQSFCKHWLNFSIILSPRSPPGFSLPLGASFPRLTARLLFFPNLLCSYQPNSIGLGYEYVRRLSWSHQRFYGTWRAVICVTNSIVGYSWGQADRDNATERGRGRACEGYFWMKGLDGISNNARSRLVGVKDFCWKGCGFFALVRWYP